MRCFHILLPGDFAILHQDEMSEKFGKEETETKKKEIKQSWQREK